MPSISFDRAADIYDQTRGFPPGIGEAVVEAALAWMPLRPRILEIGVGTGRIARPMLARGAQVWGIDLSPKMLARLVETLPGGIARPPLVLGDAVSLPFPAAVFDCLQSVHVLHLIADWRQALVEARRVLKPDGLFLMGYDWRSPDSPGERLRDQWRVIIGTRGVHNQPGAHDFVDIQSALQATGAVMEEQSVGRWSSSRTLAQHLEAIEHRTWSATWDVPENFFPDCLAELRVWALREYGGLEREFAVDHRFVWQAYRWPGATGG